SPGNRSQGTGTCNSDMAGPHHWFRCGSSWPPFYPIIPSLARELPKSPRSSPSLGAARQVLWTGWEKGDRVTPEALWEVGGISLLPDNQDFQKGSSCFSVAKDAAPVRTEPWEAPADQNLARSIRELPWCRFCRFLHRIINGAVPPMS